jgi:hypothetical protein
MTIQAVTQPYEILIRFTDGQVSGAHYKTIEVVTDGARVYSATEGQPQPLEGDAVAAVLGDTLQTALLQVQALTAALAEAESQIAEQQQSIAGLAAQVPQGPVE